MNLTDLIPAKLQPYAKAVVAFVGVLITVVVPLLPVNSTAAHIAQAVIGVLTAAGVYNAENRPADKGTRVG